MSTINLKIGGTDVSEYVLVESYTVRQIQKKSENSSFPKYDGTEVSKVLGYYYEISASLMLVPDNTAKALAAAVSWEKFNVDFTDPFGGGNAEFLKSDSTSFEVAAEVDDGLLWDIEISLRSNLIKPADGL